MKGEKIKSSSVSTLKKEAFCHYGIKNYVTVSSPCIEHLKDQIKQFVGLYMIIIQVIILPIRDKTFSIVSPIFVGTLCLSFYKVYKMQNGMIQRLLPYHYICF